MRKHVLVLLYACSFWTQYWKSTGTYEETLFFKEMHRLLISPVIQICIFLKDMYRYILTLSTIAN